MCEISILLTIFCAFVLLFHFGLFLFGLLHRNSHKKVVMFCFWGVIICWTNIWSNYTLLNGVYDDHDITMKWTQVENRSNKARKKERASDKKSENFLFYGLLSKYNWKISNVMLCYIVSVCKPTKIVLWCCCVLALLVFLSATADFNKFNSDNSK